MSYEGYEECLCKNGHNYIGSIYEETFPLCCPTCGEKTVWWRSVNLTNGDDPELPQLEINTDTEICVCKECKMPHISKQATFKIPTTFGHSI